MIDRFSQPPARKELRAIENRDQEQGNRNLDAFDFSALSDLLKEELRKSGGAEARGNRIKRDNFEVGDRDKMEEKKVLGLAHGGKYATISPVVFDEKAGELEKNDTLIHESVHLVSSDDYTHRERQLMHWIFGAAYAGYIPVALGVSLSYSNPSSVGNMFADGIFLGAALSAPFLMFDRWSKTLNRTGFRMSDMGGMLANEGMTQLIANELTPKFLERTGNTKLAQEYRNSRHHMNFDEPPPLIGKIGGSYASAQYLMHNFIYMVAQISGVPGEKVYEGFKRQYFTKGLDREIKSVFDGFFGRGFISKLKKMDPKTTKNNEVYAFVLRYFRTVVSEDMARRYG